MQTQAHLLLRSATIASLLAACSSGFAVTITHLSGGSPGGFVQASAINNSGEVAGITVFSTPSPATHAFLYSNGVMTDLGTLGGFASFGWGINNVGQVTGASEYHPISFTLAPGESYTDSHAFLYSNGAMADLGTLGGHSSAGMGINDAGQVTGWSQVIGGSAHAFLYSDGTMTDLGTLGGHQSNAFAINNAGQVTGAAETIRGDPQPHAFLYSHGVMADLGTLGGTNSVGLAINDVGQVTGAWTTVAGDQHAFIYSSGTMTDLGPRTQAGHGINNAGQVVGVSTDGYSFLYTNGTLIDLRTFGFFDRAVDINDNGQILGTNGTLLSDLPPIPIPASWMLLLSGLIVVGAISASTCSGLMNPDTPIGDNDCRRGV